MEVPDGGSELKLYEKLRKLLPHSKGGPHKRAEAAVAAMKHYELDELLYRMVFNSTGERVRRVVVPNGGLRSFLYNGRRYRLTMRRTLLLLYHDSESMGGHPSAKETLAKLADAFWWPTLEHDERRWCMTCHICRMTAHACTYG